jgi:hypothetical protein
MLPYLPVVKEVDKLIFRRTLAFGATLEAPSPVEGWLPPQ